MGEFDFIKQPDFTLPPVEKAEEVDLTNLSRAQLRETYELARKTLFRTTDGVQDIYGHKTTVKGENNDFRIYNWGSAIGSDGTVPETVGNIEATNQALTKYATKAIQPSQPFDSLRSLKVITLSLSKESRETF